MTTVNPESSAANRAYVVIREAILRGTHRPGDMLGESTLAAELAMSRTPVRAALLTLQDEGWITIYPKRGAQVRGLTPKAIADLAETRFLLESAMVAAATSAARVALGRRLAGEMDAQSTALSAGDFDAFAEQTIRFHRAFVEVGGNSVTQELDERLADRHRFVLYANAENLLSRSDAIVAEHRALVAHLIADDPGAFTQTLRNHVTDADSTDLPHT